MTPLRLGTRGSRLALAQAAMAARALEGRGTEVEVVPISTVGDRDRTRPFAELGDGGIFARELELALRDGRVDVCVHSAKDLTGAGLPGLALAACLERGDPRDAWCGPERSLAEVADGARVGSGSLRRRSQLLALRPDLRIEGLRGNVETRLRRRAERMLDGIVLAACGLDRLGLGAEIGFRFDPEQLLPEPGQGTVVLQTRAGEEALVAALDDEPTSLALAAERACAHRLGGGCTVPVAVHATRVDGDWRLVGYVGSPDGAEAIVEAATGPEPLELAATVAARLELRGRETLLGARS